MNEIKQQDNAEMLTMDVIRWARMQRREMCEPGAYLALEDWIEWLERKYQEELLVTGLKFNTEMESR